VEDGARIRIPLRAIGFDLVAAVRIAGGHPYFTRRENDITLPVPLTVAEAALGAVITVPTLTSAVAIRIPSGTPHGRTMRIRGRGEPHPDHPGDLLLTIEIVIPRSINEGQRRALEAFAAATTDSPRAHFERPVPGTAT
jgi:molecular chaperone DnaJ